MPTVSSAIAMLKLRLRSEIREKYDEPERTKLLEVYDLADTEGELVAFTASASIIGVAPGLLLYYMLGGTFPPVGLQMLALAACVVALSLLSAAVGYFSAAIPAAHAVKRLRDLLAADPSTARRLRWLADRDPTLRRMMTKVLS